MTEVANTEEIEILFLYIVESNQEVLCHKFSEMFHQEPSL